MKGLGIFVAIVMVFIFIFGLYCTFFVTSPSDVVETMFNALDEKDANTLMQCVDPRYERAYNAADNILGNFIGISFKDIADIVPLFADEIDKDMSVKYNAKICDSKIFGQKMDDFTSKIGQKIEGLGNLLGSEAYVIVEINNHKGTGRITEVIPLKNFDSDGWRAVDYAAGVKFGQIAVNQTNNNVRTNTVAFDNISDEEAKNEGKTDATAEEAKKQGRPSWRESEKAIEREYPQYKKQQSFKDKETCNYGTLLALA